MRFMIPFCVAALIVSASKARAQTSTGDSTDGVQLAQVQQPPTIATPVIAPREPRPLTFFTVVSNGFDSNVNHEMDEARSVGVVLGTGAQYRNHPTDPWLDVTYDIALHRYTQADRWNRLSQHLGPGQVVQGDLP